MVHVWKGPEYLWGKGEPVAPGEPIPDGHITPERIKELSDRIEEEPPHAPPPDGPREQSAPAAPTPGDPSFDPQLDASPEKPKRAPSRPRGSKTK